MDFERYHDLTVSTNKKIYGFTSEGPNGLIKKIVIYEELPHEKGIYNLSLASIKPNGDLGYLETSRNKDINKILATVAYTAYLFTGDYPEALIFFSGSDNVRTRKYQQAINFAYSKIDVSFIIKGIFIKDNEILGIEDFQRNKNYDAFLFEKK